MLKQARLSTKFTLILFAVFVVGIAAAYVFFSRVVEARAAAEIRERSQVLIETMNAVRRYTSTQVNPLLQPALATEPEFISESVPAYSARSVFEGLRSNPEYAVYRYKEATLNPTNPLDLADDFERGVLEQFRSQPGLRELSGFTTVNGQQVFYEARPLAVTAESCLACHGDPAQAPASLIASYGSEGGFGWQLGEIVAAQMIYVPAETVFESARIALTAVMLIIAGIFAVLILVVNFVLRRMVVRPVTDIAGLAQRITAQTVTPEAPEVRKISRIAARNDELGYTARVFESMTREVYAREQKLKEEVQQLVIQIDEQKRAAHVQQIVETDYFQMLQAKAKQMREALNSGNLTAGSVPQT